MGGIGMSSEDRLISVVDEGLGNSAYLLDLGDGRALAVDAPRDLRALRRAADKRGLKVAYAADTHLHADFLSGAVQLAAIDGSQILASSAGKRQFDHRGLDEGDEIDLGGLSLQAWATPGHTDEHLSFVIRDANTPVGVFSGGSLIVGSAARTDLLGDERTWELSRAQYASLQRLGSLPDSTALWPTHGAGSFCSAPSGSARTSTIGGEKASNALLAAADAETFARLLSASLGSYPMYFRWLPEANRRGPSVVAAEPALAPLTAAKVHELIESGAVVVDVRPIVDVAAGHLPGAISIALRPQFATWLSWTVARGKKIVVVRNSDQPPADILWPAYNIGHTAFVGELAGGVNAWAAAGQPLATIMLTMPGNLSGRVLDIRQDNEHAAGHLPRAIHIELGDLAAHADELGSEPITTMCGHGERAMTAATILQSHGLREVAVLDGGPSDWARATGNRLATGG
jgi:hydroxyacylglutathione hydrolase